jgi:hypothetical protein
MGTHVDDIDKLVSRLVIKLTLFFTAAIFATAYYFSR